MERSGSEAELVRQEVNYQGQPTRFGRAIVAVSGDYWSFPFTWQLADGSPVDLSPYTVKASVISVCGETDMSVVLVDVPAGVFRTELAESDSEDIDPNGASVIVWVIDGSNRRTTLAVIPLSIRSVGSCG